tara:strand:+ start:350 stop:646 length:297 start_codon:yes stop_codon:yes gene_type:complete
MAGFLAAAAPYAIPAGLSIAQGLLGNRQAKRDQQRMEQQAKQDKLIQSFNPQAQPTAPQQAAQQGIGQTLLNDPITKSLLSDLSQSKKFFGGKLAFGQ